ncbi:MAG: cupredoxin domain-containing protein [Deltaproteobacteria bacterium]|nr:cupredoxin domain-containing protein [Deltaproteobacteria bacterium]
MKRLSFLLLVLFMPLLPSLCLSEEGKAPFAAAIGPDGLQHVEVAGGSYYFKPERIIVRVNAPVELKLRNESSVTPHDFILKAPEAGIDISVTLRGEPTVLYFTMKKTGVYTFYCGRRFLFFKSHRNRGMEGTIEVVE